MVTTAVGMVNWVHGNTTSTGPVVSLSLVFMESSASLEQGLVDPSTTSDDTDGGTGATRDGLFRTGWETDASLVVFGRVPDDCSVGSGRPGERTTVTDLLLNAANDRSFGELAHGENISNIESSLLATVDEGAGMETFCGNESFRTEFVTVRVAEDDAGKRSATARVVDDLLNDTANVTIPFCKIEGS